MRKQILCLIGTGFLVLCMAGCSSDKTSAAKGAAKDWLKIVDSGNYAQSWEEAASVMKTTVAKEQWQQILAENRAPLGTLVSRKLTSAEYTSDLPGAPSGQYVVLKYESSFANKSSVLETATPTLEKDGKWRVSVYFVK